MSYWVVCWSCDGDGIRVGWERSLGLDWASLRGNMQANADFRWLSPLGLSVALFLGFGALHVLAGLVVPFLSRATGNRGGLTQLQLDLFMLGIFAFGLVQLGVVWLGLRARNAWGLWIVVALDAMQLAAWIVYGLRSGDWGAPLFWYDTVFLIPAFVLGLIRLR